MKLVDTSIELLLLFLIGIAAWLIASVLAGYLNRIPGQKSCAGGNHRGRGWNRQLMPLFVFFMIFMFVGHGRMKAAMVPNVLEEQNEYLEEHDVWIAGIVENLGEKNENLVLTLKGVSAEVTGENYGLIRTIVYIKKENVDGISLGQEESRVKNQQITGIQNTQLPAGAALHSSDTVVKEKNSGDSLEILRLGMKVCVYGQLTPCSVSRNPGEFDYALYYRSMKIEYTCFGEEVKITDPTYHHFLDTLYRFKQSCIHILEQIAEPGDLGIFQAAILGEKSALTPDIQDMYRKNGIAHLLAISGLHVSLIGAGVFWILRKLGLSYAGAGMLSGSVLVMYGIVTGNSSSVVRAVIMLLITFLASWLGRTYDMLSAASLALMLMLWDSPYLLLQGGVQLSFGAIAAVGGVYPMMAEYNKLGKKPENFEKTGNLKQSEELKKGFLVSLAIQMVTTPMILYHFYEYPLYGILLNLIVIPLMAYVICSGIAGIILGYVVLGAGVAAIGTGHYILALYAVLCRFMEQIPGYNLIIGRPKLWQISIYYVILTMGLIIYRNKSCRKIIAVIGLYLFCFAILLPLPVRGLEVVFLDVGQGDGIFLQTSKVNILVDCGSSSNKSLGENSLEPFLKSRGISKLDYVFVSHGDLDHVSGIEYLLGECEDISVKNMVFSCQCKGDETSSRLGELVKKRGGLVSYMSAGEEKEWGKLRFTCVYPDKNEVIEDSNDQSQVHLVDYGEFHMLLTGDVEKGGEGEMLSMVKEEADIKEKEDKWHEQTLNQKLASVQVLKVAHHGSSSSTTPEFLRLISPQWAVLSYGKSNRYGHPSQPTLEHLQEQNVHLWKTAEQGAVILKTDGKKVWWSTWIP